MQSAVEKAKEFCCCWTYRSIGLEEKCPICQLADALGETNEALAACQSEGAAWKRLAEEAGLCLSEANMWREQLEVKP